MRKVISEALEIRGTGAFPHWEQGGKTYFITFSSTLPNLKREARKITLDCIEREHDSRLNVHIATVMHNHVHILATPLWNSEGWHSLSPILKSIKGVIARQINIARGAKGQVWLSDYHNRMIRSTRELQSVFSYIAFNPIVQGFSTEDEPYEFQLVPDRTLIDF